MKELPSFLIGFLILYAIVTSLWPSDKITIYTETCLEVYRDGKNDGFFYDYLSCPDDKYLGKREFLVNIDRQLVVEKQTHTGTIQLENCAVFDVENWLCALNNSNRYTDYEAMKDGRFESRFRSEVPRVGHDGTRSSLQNWTQIPGWLHWIKSVRSYF